MKKEAQQQFTKGETDFSADFLGRRCEICTHFRAPDGCVTEEGNAIQAYPVNPDGYCDAFNFIDQEQAEQFMDQHLSLKREVLIETASHDDSESGHFYENIIGICCDTCRHFQPPNGCAIVMGHISRVCCCDLWDGKDFMGLMESKGAIFHGGIKETIAADSPAGPMTDEEMHEIVADNAQVYDLTEANQEWDEREAKMAS